MTFLHNAAEALGCILYYVFSVKTLSILFSPRKKHHNGYRCRDDLFSIDISRDYHPAQSGCLFPLYGNCFRDIPSVLSGKLEI